MNEYERGFIDGMQKQAQSSVDKAVNAMVKQPAQQEPDYAWPTVADYERDVGFQTNDAFRMGWGMARTTNKMLGIEENT